MQFQASQGKKDCKNPHFNDQKLGMVAHTCHSSYGGKCKTGGSWSRLAWAKVRPYLPEQKEMEV
jgi:hypothetical protein